MRIFARAYLCGREMDRDELKRELASLNPGCLVQAAKAGSANSEFVVEMLAAQTLRAESSGSLLAKKPEIDLLLRLAGTSQISRAIKSYGARSGEPFLLVAASRTRVREPTALKKLALPRKDLGVSELARVEKAALLNAQRA